MQARIPRPAPWLFLVLLTVYVASTRGHFLSTDEIQLYQTTRSLVERGDLTVRSTHNTAIGRDGRRYSQYNLFQAFAATPLYALGRWVDDRLDAYGAVRVRSALAGPAAGKEPRKWAGDVEMFFVNLYNAFTVALLCAVFQVFAWRRLGATLGWATVAALLLGLTTLVGAHAVAFFRHASAALFVLWTLYFLVGDAQRPDSRTRFWAGVTLGLAPQFRMAAAMSWPVLVGFALYTAHARRDRTHSLHTQREGVLRELLPFAVPLAASVVVHFALVYVRFGKFFGFYERRLFLDRSLTTSLYAYVFSPGASVFLFSPLLVLVPWLLRDLWRRGERPLVAVLLGLTATYVTVVGRSHSWHGAWCVGPRHLLPIVPVLLVPLARWLGTRSRRTLAFVGGLAAFGLVIQVLHVSVNWAYVFSAMSYSEYADRSSYIFSLEKSPIMAQLRGFLAADYRLDMWLVNVYRAEGAAMLAAFAVPLAGLLAGSAWGLWRSLPSSARSRPRSAAAAR